MKKANPSNNPKKDTPWGLWTTLGACLVVLSTWFFAQIVVAVIFVVFALVQNPQANVQKIASSGFLISLTVIASSLAGGALLVFFAQMRQSITLKKYFGLKQPTIKETLKWLLFYVAYLVLSYGLTYYFKVETPEFMLEAYKTAYFVPLLYIAFVLIGPIFEELLFRGFLFEGIRYSRLGSVGAVGITALLWSIIHLQYEVFFIIILFILGILLGIARLKSDSLYLAIFIHCLHNLLALVGTALHLQSRI